MKKLAIGLVLFIGFLSFCFVVSAIEDQKVGADEVNILILNTGDIHEASGNLEKISQYIGQKRNEYGKDRVLLLDAGDMLSHWTPKSRNPFKTPKRNWALERKEERSSKVNQMYNWAVGMNYDALILGNHDFDEGIDLLKYFSDDSNSNPPHKLPFICANLEYPSDSPFFLGKNGVVPAYKIIIKSGVKIGIIGISEQMHEGNDPNKDYHFPNKDEKKKLKAHPVNSEYIKDIIREVQKQSDFIVILSHNKDDIDEKYTAALPIDKPFIIIGGHSHKVIPEEKKLKLPEGCYLIKSGLEGECVGATAITWDMVAHKITKVKVENVSM